MPSIALTSKVAKPWELNVPKREHYNSDEVIDAYFKGKEVGRVDGLKQGSEASRQLFLKALTENLKKAGADTHKVFAVFKSQGLKAMEALLRVDSWHRFSVMIVAAEATFKSEKLLKVYDSVNDLEAREVNDQYCIRFSFVAGGKDLDFNVLEADGFMLKLKK